MSEPEIIENIVLRIPASELEVKLTARVEHHTRAVDVLENQLEEFKKWEERVKKHGYAEEMAEEEITQLISNFKGISEEYGTSPGKALKREIESRKKNILFFKYFVAHLVEGAFYDLDEADINRLQLLK